MIAPAWVCFLRPRPEHEPAHYGERSSPPVRSLPNPGVIAWAGLDSNQGPRDYESPALTELSYRPPEATLRPGGDLSLLIEEALQPLRARGVPQLPQRLGLDLAYALARDVELLADLFQRVVGRHLDAEAHAQDLRLAGREGVEHFLGDVAQGRVGRRVRGRHGRLVLDEVAEVRVVVVADRRLHGDRLLGDLQDLADLLLGHLHALGEGRRVGLLPGLLQDLAADAVHLVDGLDHVHRDADGARLVGDRARDGLADPPRGVGRELVAAAVFELVDRLHQADVAFLDQVEELQAA